MEKVCKTLKALQNFLSHFPCDFIYAILARCSSISCLK
uniref:Uncharacterized protein n=1 Tax=Lepeophtheirus salmonis TaxID=72036 RepID=A0A0K2VB48_LEPSM